MPRGDPALGKWGSWRKQRVRVSQPGLRLIYKYEGQEPPSIQTKVWVLQTQQLAN